MFFNHCASKNQLSGLSVSGTLGKNRVKKALLLSAHVIKLKMTTLLSCQVFSINLFWLSNLLRTTLNGSLTVLISPACKNKQGIFLTVT